jgi:hypothetical protein
MAEPTQFKSISGIDWAPGGAGYGTAKYGDDSNLLVSFYNKAVEIPHKSQQMGRRYCENQIYVRIQHPGETLNIIDTPANDSHKQRFRAQWSRFIQNRTQIPEGTPIDLLFPNHPSVGENLRGIGIYTIEQCAAMSASAMDNVGRGGQEYVNKAKKYLESSEKGKNFHLMQAELDKMKTENRVLNTQVGQLKAQLDSVLQRINDPVHASLSPPFIQGYDPQTERINATHVTGELGKKPRKSFIKPEVEKDPITDELA